MTRLVLLLSLLFLGTGGFAQNEANHININDGIPLTIVIQDEQLRPLVGAIVEMTSPGRLRQFGKSNEKGEINFYTQPQLGYRLIIRHIGFADWNQLISQEVLALNFLRIVMEPTILSTDSTTIVGKKKLTELQQRRQNK
jgi:hypothetical protein